MIRIRWFGPKQILTALPLIWWPRSKALLQGLQLCVKYGVGAVDNEIDSQILLYVLQKKVQAPWAVEFEIRAIFHLLHGMDTSIEHIYREGNAAADFLANLPCLG